MFSKLLYLAENMTVNRILYYKYLIFFTKKGEKMGRSQEKGRQQRILRMD